MNNKKAKALRKQARAMAIAPTGLSNYKRKDGVNTLKNNNSGIFVANTEGSYRDIYQALKRKAKN